jgi:glutathione S-transferase
MMTGEHKAPAFLALNPAGTVPILQCGPEDIIRQSTSIMEYLEELHPEPNLIGRTPLERARTRDAMMLINDVYLYHLNYLAQKSPIFATMMAQSDAAADAFHGRYLRHLHELEVMASGEAFLTGPNVTIADCMFFASAQYCAEVYREPLPADCPKLRAVYERFSKRPSASLPHYPEQFLQAAPFRALAA